MSRPRSTAGTTARRWIWCARHLAALGHLVSAGSSPNHGELLSYLFFAEEFSARLIELGHRDATRWLSDPGHDDGHWQLSPLR